MRGMRISVAIYYYITAMMPAWIFLVFRIISDSEVEFNKSDKKIIIICATFILVLCIFVSMFILLEKNLKRKSYSSSKFKVSSITTINDSFINFIITFTAPHLILDIDYSDLLTVFVFHLLFHIIIFTIYYNSSAIVPNIYLFFRGYHLYNFNHKYWVITKENNLRSYTYDIKVHRLGDYLYYRIGDDQK